MEKAYTVEVREQGRRTYLQPIPDPFILTRIKPTGWRKALAVLFRRFEIEVIVGGERSRVEAVLEFNPDYIGPRGSKSREAWDAQVQQRLSEVGKLA